MKNNTSAIFQQLNRIGRTLARIDEQTKNINHLATDHEKRIRELESKEARRGGILAALTTIGSAVGAALTWLIQYLTGGTR